MADTSALTRLSVCALAPEAASAAAAVPQKKQRGSRNHDRVAAFDLRQAGEIALARIAFQ